MKSMTGYGISQISNKDLNIEIHVKSVNGRFFEPRIHMPKEYLPIEGEIKKKLGSVFRRGNIDVFINRKFLSGKNNKIYFKKDVAKQWFDAYNQLAKQFKLKDGVGLETLASLPEVLLLQDRDSVSLSEKKLIVQQVLSAAKKCDAERKREGLALKKELSKLLSQLERQRTKLAKLAKASQIDFKKSFETRIKNKSRKIELDSNRLAQELILFVDRSDICEEIDRLKEHIRSYVNLLSSNELKGKKLEFYTQELLREINTIGSKSQSAKLTEHVVEAKSIIEKLREQVQNIE